jgi:lysophospholipase L1-like esterase
MDAYLIVDPDSRNITIPEVESAFGVYGDNNAERKYFKSPRIVGNGIDLTECYLYVNYISASTKIGQILCDVGDAPNGTATEDEIVFSWPITRNVLDKNISGEIFFAVQAKTKTGDTVFTTRKAKGNCYESIEGTEAVTEEYADIVLQLISRMDKVEENIGVEVDNYFKENPAVTSEYLTQTLQPIKDDVGSIKEDIGNLNKEKLDSNVVYEVGEDGEVVSSTKMMDISGNGEIAKISADSVYKDNIIPLPNIAEKTVNGLTYSVKDGIISLNGTATTYTLIDLGVNLSMMDGLSAIGYKIFILDGTIPSGMSIILGLSFGGYAQTLTNTVQEKKSSSLIAFNNKNIGISINNATAINVKFGVVVIPINDIPLKFNVGKKYAGYMLNQLICTNNMWAFGANISKIKLAQYYRFRKNKLYGKSLFVAGDSVAFGFGSGGKSYADIIAEKNKMSMKKVAVSGTTFAKRDGMTNSILEQVQMMDKLYDYVLIEGGFNDYFQRNNGVSIGTMPKNMNSGRDDKTTYGALDSICLWIKQNYPASKILFVVPHKIMTNAGVLDDGFYPYLQAIRNVCEKYSISYADIALKGGCTPFYQEFRDTYFSGDGIHLNLEGYEFFYVPRIEAEMEML